MTYGTMIGLHIAVGSLYSSTLYTQQPGGYEKITRASPAWSASATADAFPFLRVDIFIGLLETAVLKKSGILRGCSAHAMHPAVTFVSLYAAVVLAQCTRAKQIKKDDSLVWASRPHYDNNAKRRLLPTTVRELRDTSTQQRNTQFSWKTEHQNF